MYKHFIVIADSYQMGSRIGYKETTLRTDRGLIKTVTNITDILKANDVTSYSTHLIDTDEDNWQSIVESDPFFKNIILLKSLDEFIKCSKDEITIEDVAEYVTEQQSITASSLMKIVYLIYSEYLAKYNQPLFPNNFIVSKNGPIDPILWDKYAHTKGKKINPIFQNTDYSPSPVICKLLKLNEYENIKNIVATLLNSKEYSFPRDLTFEDNRKSKMTDDIILKYHSSEYIK